MKAGIAFALFMAAACSRAFAHSAPQSIVKIEFLPHSVRAEILVPESELAFATAAENASLPFAQYLLRHLAAETSSGVAWTVAVRAVRNTRYLEHPYLLAEVELTPPAGASLQSFVLVDDVVTHEVRNHVVMVLALGAANPRFLGALQYPQRRLAIQNSH